jgi:hypothetical protein
MICLAEVVAYETNASRSSPNQKGLVPSDGQTTERFFRQSPSFAAIDCSGKGVGDGNQVW